MLQTIQLTADSIYILGDMHGIYIKLFNLINQGVFSNSIIIAVGDFGVGFGGDEVKTLNKLNRRLSKTNTKLFVVRGNHDNPNWFKTTIDKTLKIPIFTNIVFVEDYTVLTVLCNENKTNILCIGGAISIDRILRKENVDWWKDEKLVIDHDKLKEIKENNLKIDVICTHNAPDFCYPFGLNELSKNQINDINQVLNGDNLLNVMLYEWVTINQLCKNMGIKLIQLTLLVDKTLKEEIINERLEFSELYENLKDYGVSKWYYGHFHESHVEYINDVKFRLLNIDEIEELR